MYIFKKIMKNLKINFVTTMDPKRNPTVPKVCILILFNFQDTCIQNIK